MEIKINIPQNTYRVPTEIREEVVQKVCDALLADLAPDHYGWDHLAKYHQHIYEDENGKIGFGDCMPGGNKKRICTPRGVEAQVAFDALLRAGYYIFSTCPRGLRYYKIGIKPVDDLDWNRTETFNEFID